MNNIFQRVLFFLLIVSISPASRFETVNNRPYVIILGITQDGGFPRAGCKQICCAKAWNDPNLSEKVSSIAIIDPRTKLAWVIDPTPDFPSQLELITSKHNSKLAGILISHAHIGHYSGLINLGAEAMDSKNIPVYVMPMMERFLKKNAPWSQLVQLNNIRLQPLKNGKELQIGENLLIEPFLVPHHHKFSETIGFKIISDKNSLIYLPDINKWETWGHDISKWIEVSTYALLDGTFYSKNELKNRNSTEITHPLIIESYKFFNNITPSDKKKIYFIHLNHTNPAIKKNSAASNIIRGKGFNIAREGLIFRL